MNSIPLILKQQSDPELGYNYYTLHVLNNDDGHEDDGDDLESVHHDHPRAKTVSRMFQQLVSNSAGLIIMKFLKEYRLLFG